MIYLNILIKRTYVMRKLNVPEKYNGKKLTKFILDTFPNLSPNMLFKALRQKDIKIDEFSK